MTVGVGAFKALVFNTVSQGHYLVQSDANINLDFEPGEASVARTDRIILRVYNDPQDGSGQTGVAVEYLKGQSSGSATPIPDNSMVLWEVPVPAGTSAGTGGINFVNTAVDKRFYTTASGGIIPVENNGDMTSIVNPYEGMAVLVKSNDVLYIYDGTAWRARSQISVASSGNLTGIVNPYEGLLAYVRDVDRVYFYDGSAWKTSEPRTIANKFMVSSQSGFASTTYQNIPGTSAISIVKDRLQTKLRVDMKLTAFAETAGSSGLQLGVQINGVDYDVAKGYYTSINSYETFSGFAVITNNLIPGTINVTPRWRRYSGSGTFTTNNAISELDIAVSEVFQ